MESEGCSVAEKILLWQTDAPYTEYSPGQASLRFSAIRHRAAGGPWWYAPAADTAIRLPMKGSLWQGCCKTQAFPPMYWIIG